jgi:hypothetical protein
VGISPSKVNFDFTRKGQFAVNLLMEEVEMEKERLEEIVDMVEKFRDTHNKQLVEQGLTFPQVVARNVATILVSLKLELLPKHGDLFDCVFSYLNLCLSEYLLGVANLLLDDGETALPTCEEIHEKLKLQQSTWWDFFNSHLNIERSINKIIV